MSWSKMLVSAMLVVILFDGCAEITSGIVTKAFYPNLQNAKEPLYLETVDNEEFKKFLLEKNLIKGLNENDILWVDNAGNEYGVIPHLYSSKIVLTNDSIYLVRTIFGKGLTNENYKNYAYESKWWLNTFKNHLYQETQKCGYGITTKMLDNKKMLYIDGGSFWCSNSFWARIQSRYNDIEKIKSIIDERVAYFKKLQADSAQK